MERDTQRSSEGLFWARIVEAAMLGQPLNLRATAEAVEAGERLHTTAADRIMEIVRDYQVPAGEITGFLDDLQNLCFSVVQLRRASGAEAYTDLLGVLVEHEPDFIPWTREYVDRVDTVIWPLLTVPLPKERS